MESIINYTMKKKKNPLHPHYLELINKNFAHLEHKIKEMQQNMRMLMILDRKKKKKWESIITLVIVPILISIVASIIATYITNVYNKNEEDNKYAIQVQISQNALRDLDFKYQSYQYSSQIQKAEDMLLDISTLEKYNLKEFRTAIAFYRGLYHSYLSKPNEENQTPNSYFSMIDSESKYFLESRLEMYNNEIMKYGLFYPYIQKYDPSLKDRIHNYCNELFEIYSSYGLNRIDGFTVKYMLLYYSFVNSISDIYDLFFLENVANNIIYDSESDRYARYSTNFRYDEYDSNYLQKSDALKYIQVVRIFLEIAKSKYDIELREKFLHYLKFDSTHDAIVFCAYIEHALFVLSKRRYLDGDIFDMIDKLNFLLKKHYEEKNEFSKKE